jgi:hypothetical protein
MKFRDCSAMTLNSSLLLIIKKLYAAVDSDLDFAILKSRDVVLGTRTRTRVLLEYNFQVLVLVLVLDTWVLVLVLVLAVNISTRTRTCTRSACTNIILPTLRKLKLSH